MTQPEGTQFAVDPWCPTASAPLLARCGMNLALVVVIGACASLPPPPLRPINGRRAAMSRGFDHDRAPQGGLRSGDLLIVAVTSGAETKERTAQVDARGELHAASGRDVHVAGLELAQAEARVAEAVHQSEKHAEVNLRLVAGPNRRISVLGALARPGYLTLAPGMRVVDLIAAAGGILTLSATGRPMPLPVADLEGSVLVRDGRALPISLREALRGEPRHNVYIYPGDQLYVPLATDRFVSVLGQVEAPGAFIHRSGMRLTEALSEAGGVTPGGDKTDVRLVRGPVSNPKVYRSSLRAIADGAQHDVALAPGDVLFVQDHPMEDVGEVLQLLAPLASVGLVVLLILLVASS